MVKKTGKESGPAKELITKEMTLGDVVQKFGMPAVEVMGKYGLHCIGCHVAAWETIDQGAKAHGMSPRDIQKMVDDLNKAVKNK